MLSTISSLPCPLLLLPSVLPPESGLFQHQVTQGENVKGKQQVPGSRGTLAPMGGQEEKIEKCFIAYNSTAPVIPLPYILRDLLVEILFHFLISEEKQKNVTAKAEALFEWLLMTKSDVKKILPQIQSLLYKAVRIQLVQ